MGSASGEEAALLAHPNLWHKLFRCYSYCFGTAQEQRMEYQGQGFEMRRM